jgi:hypothetical protein
MTISPKSDQDLEKATQETSVTVGALDIPEMRYQEQYVWLIFVSSLDIMLTWHILRIGGEEVNPIARIVIDTWGLGGAVAFKFSLMLFVIISCEVVGRKQDGTGRKLVLFAIFISSCPPIWSAVLLMIHGISGPGGI